MTDQQQPRTAAQQKWDNREAFTVHGHAKFAFDRAEEVATDLGAQIAALRDTVAALQEQVSNNYGNADSRIRNIYSSHITPMRDRLTALESPASAPVPDGADVCRCGHRAEVHPTLGNCWHQSGCDCRKFVKAEAAPEPVCPTCKGENDCQIEARYPNGDGCGYFKDCPDCDGTGFVPVEPTAAVPDAGAALDSMRLALIRLLNMLTLTQVNALGEDDMKLIFGKVGDVQIEEHLQAYGKPGANPKLVVPEKTVAIRAYGRDGAR